MEIVLQPDDIPNLLYSVFFTGVTDRVKDHEVFTREGKRDKRSGFVLTLHSLRHKSF